MPRCVLIAGTCLLAAAAAVETRQQSAERARDLVRVDLSVVTRDGDPVKDLRPDEISVRLGGKARQVKSLQLVTVAPAGSGAAGSRLPPPFGSNVQDAAGRHLILALDQDSLRPGSEGPLRGAVDTLLSSLSSVDRVALVTVPLGGLRVPPTSDHARVRTALWGIVGQSSGRETPQDQACRSRSALEALIAFMQTMGYREAPATIIFLSGGLSAPRRDAAVTRAPGRCELPVDLFRRVSEVASRARAGFYVVQAVDIVRSGSIASENIAGTGFTGSDNPVEGLEHLAGVTGGTLLPLAGAFDRAARETSAYYVAGLDPRDIEQDGRALSLEVRVARPDVVVRARPLVAFPKADWAAPRPANPSPRHMLGVATVFTDLPLRASGFTSLDPDGKTLRVTTVAEPIEPGTKLTSLVAALYDRDGKLIANWVAAEADLARPTIAGAMNVEPGAYRLRVAAIDAAGRSGTADHELSVELGQTGPLKLSSVVLGLSRDGAFVPRLEFSNEPVAIGYIEMYGGSAGMRVSATLEIARELNGPAMLAVPLAISPTAEGRYVAKGAVPVGGLAPGDYAVRAIVGIEGQPETRVTTTLRKR